MKTGGAGSVVFGIQPSNTTWGRLSSDGGNASNANPDAGLGGVPLLDRGRPGSRGELSTGGGAGLYGMADAALVATFADQSFPAAGFFPDPQLNETEKAKFRPLVGGR